MTTLLAHIEKLNAEKQAWMDAGPDRWTGMITTDLDHWAEYGVFTVEDYERYELEAYIWDAYKDAYGYRPRHMDFKSMSLAELEAEADRVTEAARAQYEEEKAQEERDLAEFKATVQKTVELGAGDEETALRWLTQDEEFYSGQCVEHWVYNQGILFTDYGRKLVDRLLEMVTFKEFSYD